MASLLASGDDAANDHRYDQIALARSLAIDEFPEAQPAHGDAHGLHMPMWQRADAFEATARGRKLLTPGTSRMASACSCVSADRLAMVRFLMHSRTLSRSRIAGLEPRLGTKSMRRI